ncbi:MAG: lasso peptide biosynthesis B2 protein [Spirochaetales bacterium]|nr:lasso peptide biosynthesis B2 protein [Spirochaetales bacterium]
MRRYLALSREERSLLPRVFLLVVGLRIGLSLLPFGVFKRWAARCGEASPRTTGRAGVPASTLVRAVQASGRLVPGASCLVQALAVRAMLERHGYHAELHLGVAKGDSGRLTAHAWVVHEGRIVIGGPESAGVYTPFPLDGTGRRL